MVRINCRLQSTLLLRSRKGQSSSSLLIINGQWQHYVKTWQNNWHFYYLSNHIISWDKADPSGVNEVISRPIGCGNKSSGISHHELCMVDACVRHYWIDSYDGTRDIEQEDKNKTAFRLRQCQLFGAAFWGFHHQFLTVVGLTLKYFLKSWLLKNQLSNLETVFITLLASVPWVTGSKKERTFFGICSFQNDWLTVRVFVLIYSTETGVYCPDDRLDYD